MTIDELVRILSELPPEWHVYATKAGDSLYIWHPGSARFGYVFTDGRATLMQTDRRREHELTHGR
jgi:hypothetical protein